MYFLGFHLDNQNIGFKMIVAGRQVHGMGDIMVRYRLSKSLSWWMLIALLKRIK